VDLDPVGEVDASLEIGLSLLPSWSVSSNLLSCDEKLENSLFHALIYWIRFKLRAI